MVISVSLSVRYPTPYTNHLTPSSWLHDRGDAFRAGVKIATLDPFHGYKNAINEKLGDAEVVVDAFYAEVLVMPMLLRCA